MQQRAQEAAARNEFARCVCQLEAPAPATPTSRGLRQHGHTKHAPKHLDPRCPHSTLQDTTRPREISKREERRRKRSRD